MKYNSKYTGQYYQMQGGEVYTLRGDGKFAYAGAESNSMVGVQLTGYYKQGTNGIMYQCTNGGWVDLADGWQYIGYAPVRQYTQKDAQYYVNKIIRANANILENNLFCARFANKLTEDQQHQLRGLQNRLESRNNRLLSDGLCSNQQVSTPPGYADLQVYLNALMNYESIGAVISTTTIVVIAVVVASLATAAYFAYKYLASEAEKDLKYSDELTRTLMSKLTEEEYQQLMQETQGIVTKAKLISKLGGGLSVIKWVLVGLGGYALYKAIRNRKGE